MHIDETMELKPSQCMRFLGAEILVDDAGLAITQRKYIAQELLLRGWLHMKGSESLPTPREGQIPPEEHGGDWEKAKQLSQKECGVLMWIALRSRPDIAACSHSSDNTSCRSFENHQRDLEILAFNLGPGGALLPSRRGAMANEDCVRCIAGSWRIEEQVWNCHHVWQTPRGMEVPTAGLSSLVCYGSGVGRYGIGVPGRHQVVGNAGEHLG